MVLHGLRLFILLLRVHSWLDVRVALKEDV